MTIATYLGCHPVPAVRPFRQKAREVFDRLLDHILEQGRYSLRQLQPTTAQNGSEFRVLVQAGYLHLSPDNHPELTDLALRASEERVLMDLFSTHGPSLPGLHSLAEGGSSPEAGEELKPHQPGSPLDHLDIPATLGHALLRGLPLQLQPDDIHHRPAESSGRCCTVLLLDLSGSMARHGKFIQARRGALALRALIRRRFPGDELITAGFATKAELLPGRTLLDAMPKNVGLFDAQQAEFRVSVEDTDVPEHFTNIQAGLQLARRVLRKKSNQLRQIILLTDGEPTAHLERNELVLAYPPTQSALDYTLREAALCARECIALSVIGILGEFSPEGLRSFVEQLARAGRGTSLCSASRRLGMNLLEQFTRTRSTLR